MTLRDNRAERRQLLCALYRERKARPLGRGLFIGKPEMLAGSWLAFDALYLVEKGLVTVSAGYLKLTAAGVDAVEEETYGR